MISVDRRSEVGPCIQIDSWAKPGRLDVILRNGVGSAVQRHTYDFCRGWDLDFAQEPKDVIQLVPCAIRTHLADLLQGKNPGLVGIRRLRLCYLAIETAEAILEQIQTA